MSSEQPKFWSYSYKLSPTQWTFGYTYNPSTYASDEDSWMYEGSMSDEDADAVAKAADALYYHRLVNEEMTRLAQIDSQISSSDFKEAQEMLDEIFKPRA